jgi:hypothetical protein
MDFLKKDDTLTIQLPGSNLVFTQYLYIKEEVILALLVSILNKSDKAIFWAYELYYSGFKYELLNLIWKIYYDFFATLNPAYESYLFKKHKELLSDNKQNEYIICSIINDLLFRPFNSDVFMLRIVCETFIIEINLNNTKETELYNMFKQWITNNDFRSIAQWVLNMNKSVSLLKIYEICLDIFDVKIKSKLTK